MLQTDSAKAFDLPDGSFVVVRASGGDVGFDPKDTRTWKSVDISLVDKNGFEEVLCAVEYEDQLGLRTIVFDRDQEDPVFILGLKAETENGKEISE